MKILIFLHGTTIMHRSGIGHTRAERVQQCLAHDPTVLQYAMYVPIGQAVAKIAGWQAQGAEIAYLSSHRLPEDVAADQAVLERYGFPQGPVFFRREGETYQEIVARVLPDVLIEDDCESIGGAAKIIAPQLGPVLQQSIASIVVPEFAGIDELPDDSAAFVANRNAG